MKKILTILASLSLIFAFVAPALADTALSMTSSGTDSVQIHVSSYPGATVEIFYNIAAPGGMKKRAIGSTDSYGKLNTTVSTSEFGATPGTQAYVMVNNSQISGYQIWPVNSGSGSTLALSQTNFSLATGQSTAITVSNASGGVYIGSNSNPSVANFSVSGTQVIVTALNSGSTSANICAQGSSSNCSTLSVNVSAASSGAISFSPANPSLISGQSISVNVSGSSGSYYISSNSNPSTVQTSLSGSQLHLTAYSTNGAASIVVCSSGSGGCGTFYVTVGTGASSGSSISFSQNNLHMNTGGNQALTIYGSGPFYVSSNSDPKAAFTSLSNNNLTVYAGVTGNTTIRVCQEGNTQNCSSLYVTVNGGANTPITFSKNDPSVATGQSTNVTIYGGNGSYYINSHSNSNVAGLTISGSTLTISGGVIGTSSISICSDSSNCASLSVTTGASSANSQVSLSQSSLALSIGQTQNVYIYGGNGSYNLPSTFLNVQTTLSGNILSIIGQSAGSTNVVVCSNSGGCASLAVTVSGTIAGGGVSFSQPNLSLTTGQNALVTLSGSGGYYISGLANSNIVQPTISGNILTVYGVNPGSITITVCQANGQCTGLPVNISSNYSSGSAITFSPSNPSLAIGGRVNIILSGSSGSYYLTSGDSNIVQAQVSGNTLSLTGLTAGSATLTICSNSGGCATLTATVSANSSSGGSTTNPPATDETSALLAQVKMLQDQLLALQKLTGGQVAGDNTDTPAPTTKYKFIKPLDVGSEGKDVTELQKRLTQEGYYDYAITGYYGPITQSAVKRYQKAHGLDQLGNVGPGTRAALNK